MRINETPKPIWIKHFTVVHIHDVITYTNFSDHQLRDFWVAGIKFPPFPQTFIVALTTSRTAVLVSDYASVLYRFYRAMICMVEWFRVKKRVRQGCVLSPYLLNILAEMVMRETLDGFQGGLQIGGRMITNLRYTDDIILLATSEAELQELVDRLDRVSRKYSLLVNVDKTKVMASDGIACRILIQNEQLEQVDTLGP